jgi:hypothetical protein
MTSRLHNYYLMSFAARRIIYFQAIEGGCEIQDLTTERVRAIERAMQELDSVRQKAIDSAAMALNPVVCLIFCMGIDILTCYLAGVQAQHIYRRLGRVLDIWQGSLDTL